jgi:hypothetical protein
MKKQLFLTKIDGINTDGSYINVTCDTKNKRNIILFQDIDELFDALWRSEAEGVKQKPQTKKHYWTYKRIFELKSFFFHKF